MIIVSRVNDCDYSIARPSPLGNPYPMKTEADRDTVCDQHLVYFEQKILENDPVILNELRKINKLAENKPVFKIGCFCTPRRCHGDPIAYFLNNYKDSLNE